ncbi:hypothetical protein ACM46_18515 [Chryseobacterium angstadtii]|uniref:Methyltransferase domain-containing protein n=1 Tax=Chryseobacterium angstadtii TaxID=558151 RepID=A0A0J7I1S1_9FLAO|nr:class I SAM-dependent methyltransferase [Chryseobacterium angstadtii]KMQ60217.1 hypothetical protein ACM46_18515 [Chryseobacterium angstadtii]
MDKYTETFNTWNSVAGLYAGKFMDLDLYDDTYDAFAAAIAKEDARILELGCGPGNITRYLLNRNPSWQIEAVDMAPNMIALAEKLNTRARFRVMDVRNISMIATAGTYNGIICGFCIPYLDQGEVEKLIGDAYRLLAPGGILYCSFEEGDYEQSGFLTGSSGDRVYFYYYAATELAEMIRHGSFRLTDTFSKAYINNDESVATHVIMIARK